MKDYLKKAKRAIAKPSVKVVSFDIFDTLLVRPCIYPGDLFALCDKRAKKEEPGSDFFKLRRDAESQLNIKNANIHQIWEHIQKANHLESAVAERLKQLELMTESQLLRARSLIVELYDFACQHGKRIIAISDMYLPESVLKPILVREGFDRVEKIYVSCDCDARKTDEAENLYQYVCGKENIKACEMVHIGDNYGSDYLQAEKSGVHACCVPSNVKLFLSGLPGKPKDPSEIFPSEPLQRTVFGFAINRFVQQTDFSCKSFRLEDFSALVLLPILLNLNFLLCGEEIQKSYANIQFVSRDGYLPLKSYEIFRQALGSGLLEGEYLYASRLSYRCLVEDSFYDRLKNDAFSDSFTLRDYLRALVSDKNALEAFLAQLDPDSLALSASKNRDECLEACGKLEPGISEYFEKKRQLTRAYYAGRQKPLRNRILVFDSGYNGSVSMLSKAAEPSCIVDKVYIWGSEENQRRDQRDGSVTYLVSDEKPFERCAAYELWISHPTDGTCIGITSADGKAVPYLEEKTVSAEALRDIERIQKTALGAVKEFAETFGDLVFLYADTHEISAYTKLADLFLEQPRILSLFKHLQFEDAVSKVYDHRSLSDFLKANNRGTVMAQSRPSLKNLSQKVPTLIGYYISYFKTYGINAATKMALEYLFRK